MPAEITSGRFCGSWFATYHVTGSKGANYVVTLNGGESWPHCTCPAFQYADPNDKSCKHVRYVMDKACLWNCQWHDGNKRLGLLRPVEVWSRNVIPRDRCPNCGGKVVAVMIAV